MRDMHYCMIFDESGGHHAQTNPPHPLISYTFTVYPGYSKVSFVFPLYRYYSITLVYAIGKGLLEKMQMSNLGIKRQLRAIFEC